MYFNYEKLLWIDGIKNKKKDKEFYVRFVYFKSKVFICIVKEG